MVGNLLAVWATGAIGLFSPALRPPRMAVLHVDKSGLTTFSPQNRPF